MRWTWLADRLVPVLDALVEGAWLAVVYDLVEIGFAHRPAALGVVPFAVAAGVGLAWTRRGFRPAIAGSGLFGILVVAFVVGAIVRAGGWLTPGESLLDDLIGNPGGWFAVLAVLRGTRHQLREDDDLVISGLLQYVLPALAVPWVIGVAVSEPYRSQFAAAAFAATLLFVATGLLALGLARLEALGATDRVDWRRNRSWVLLFVGILVVMTAIAVPAAFLLGVPITLLLVAMLGPLVIIATPILDLLGRILLVLLTPLDWIVAFLRSLIHPNPNAATNPTAGIPSPSPLGSPGAAGTAGASILVIAIIAGLALLALIVLIRLSKTSRPSRPRDGGLDERTIDLPELGLHLPAFRRPRLTRRGSPVTATTAYLFFLRDLEGFERLRRRPSEAPGSHARRLRAEGIADPAAALLAADYQLERYALLPLSEAETRRGIARWRRLRDVIHQHGTSSNDEAGPAS